MVIYFCIILQVVSPLLDTMSQFATINIPSIKKTITVPTGLFINNEFVASVDSTDIIQFVWMQFFRRPPDLSAVRSTRLLKT